MKLSLKLSLIFFWLFAVSSIAQENTTNLLIKPFLQDATPHSIIIKWETKSGEESIVEWGATTQLGKKTKGKAEELNYGDAILHEVKLTNLKRFTQYYYRVRTGKTVSKTYQFKTPPFAEDHESFNILAMSDMQRDWRYPNKFNEVVNQGVLTYVGKKYTGDLADKVGMILIPGDLVVDGTNFSEWKDYFFNPGENLFTNVPVYPVLGNHEYNSLFYFNYFSLPENGTPAYAENWWYKDYGNTRVIGLNSNDGYDKIKHQIEWLNKVLAETAKNDEIDFVFAQMHHPHKSELWIPGESDFSTKVVNILEKFTTATGKPSIHFFGHTHGYSRGQSKSHKHVMVNVATAGGAIDNWGEFEGRDYAEFTKTEDEYGFVMVEVDADKNDPKFTLKRISLGNETITRDNEVRDSVVIWKNARKPNTPKTISPKNKTIPVTNITLKAAPFESSFKGGLHGASQWQIAEQKSFEKTVIDRWKQFENWYYAEDRQKDDDLTDEEIVRLKANTTYYWRVRYRDQNLNWSDWSEVETFKTK